MTTRHALCAAGGLLLVATIAIVHVSEGDAAPTAPASAPPSTAALSEPVVAESPGIERAPVAGPAAVSSTTFAPAAPAPPSAELPATLDVEVDGHHLTWTLDQVRAVPRAGGTHDVRELASALLGVTDVTVWLEGLQEGAGARSAKIDLRRLGSTDQLRVWPELDGTWTVARNRTSADGKNTREVYRLTGVRTLAFARAS